LSENWTITASDGTLYTVVTDVTTTYWAVITGAVTDEILGSFFSPGFTVEQARADLQTKTTAQGLYAVTGYPTQSFPQLSTTSYIVDLTLEAPGFRNYPLQVTIPVNAIFPVSAPPTAMRRLPVRLQGRVIQDSTGLPVTGALVLTVDNPSPPSPPPPPPIPHTMLLRSPLYSSHAAAATVQAVTLATVGSASLTQGAPAGATTLTLTTTAGLSGGDLVQISTPSAVLMEYGPVLSLGPQAGQVTLATPLNRSYGAGAATHVTFVTATASGAAASLLLDADAGDSVVVADQLMSGGTLAIDVGTPAVEYHELGAIADGNGYYGVNGVGRVVELFLQASSSGVPVSWVIEYDNATNVVDFRI
jgi:hypothetical protein